MLLLDCCCFLLLFPHVLSFILVFTCYFSMAFLRQRDSENQGIYCGCQSIFIQLLTRFLCSGCEELSPHLFRIYVIISLIGSQCCQEAEREEGQRSRFLFFSSSINLLISTFLIQNKPDIQSKEGKPEKDKSRSVSTQIEASRPSPLCPLKQSKLMIFCLTVFLCFFIVLLLSCV